MLLFGILPILIITMISETVGTDYYDDDNDFYKNEYDDNDYANAMPSRHPDGPTATTNKTPDEDKYPVISYLLETANQLIYGPNWRSSLSQLPGYYEYPQSESDNWRAVFSDDMDINKDGILSKDEIKSKIFKGLEMIYKILSPGYNRIIYLEHISQDLSKVSVDVNDVMEVASFILDMIPERYFSIDYDYYLDDDVDGLVSLVEIVESINFWLGSKMELTDDAVDVIEEAFAYIDDNDDGQLSITDLKPKSKELIKFIFNFIDQDNDGRIYLSEITTDLFKFEHEDLASVLDAFKANGDIDLNHYLIPFGLDLNKDGVVNNFDFYFLSGDQSISNWYDLGIFMALDTLKLVDQDQDGVYTFDEIQNFFNTFWNLLDANKDNDVSLQDGYYLLRTLYNVNDAKMMILEDYVSKLKIYFVEDLKGFLSFAFGKMNQNQDQWISLEEFYQMPMICFSQEKNDSCFQSKDFPTVPMSLDDSFFFAHLKWNDMPTKQNGYFFDFVLPFVYYVLDSPAFYPKKGTSYISYILLCSIYFI